MQQLDEKINDLSLNTVVLADRHGEPLYINCNAVYVQNEKKMRKAGVTDPADYELIKKRSKELKEIQISKGGNTRIVNGYITGRRYSNVTDWKKGEILEQFGEYKGIDQVFDWLKEQGLAVQRGKLVELYQNNLDEIKDRRLRYISRSRDTVLATETGRIEALSYLYSEALKQWEQTHNRGYMSEARGVIEQLRREVKGDEIKLTVNGQIDFTATIQANRSLSDFMSKIPVNMLVVSLVAGKRGINPADVMAQLTNSFYNRWNGFGTEQASEKEEIKLPSHYIKNYDWATIESKHRDKEEQATNMLYHKKLKDFFRREGIQYENNLQDAIQQLKIACSEEITSEIIDVRPIEVEVVEPEKKEEVMDAKQRLKEILALRRKQLNKDE